METWLQTEARKNEEELRAQKDRVIAAGGTWCDTCANLGWVSNAQSRLVHCPNCTIAGAHSEPTQPKSTPISPPEHWTEVFELTEET